MKLNPTDSDNFKYMKEECNTVQQQPYATCGKCQMNFTTLKKSYNK